MSRGRGVVIDVIDPPPLMRSPPPIPPICRSRERPEHPRAADRASIHDDVQGRTTTATKDDGR